MRRPPGKEMLDRARRLRRDMTDAERLLWSRLRAGQLGVKFRKQVWLGPFIADFLSVEAKLVVEVDGGQHAENRENDDRRAGVMAELGYRTLRFWNNDVLENIDGVLITIANALPSPQTPLPERGRGFMPRSAPPLSHLGRGRGPPRSGERGRE